MLEPYAAKLNCVITSIYDSVMQVEEQMLVKSVPDLSIGELHILETVWQRRDMGCSISDIAQAHQVTLPSMTVAVKKLETKGYVQKMRSDTDGRVVYVALTRRGDKVNAMHRYFHEHMVRSVLRDIDETQRPALLAALESMDAYLKQQLEKSTK
jgi:DNA-binding MarR family transcriptional regulator